MKKRKTQALKTALAALLLLVFSVIPLIATATSAIPEDRAVTVAEESDEPTVRLEWDSSVGKNSAGIAYRQNDSRILTAKVILSGAIAEGEEVTVHVGTFDISARATYDYGPVDTTVTLNSANTEKTIRIPLYNVQLDWVTGGAPIQTFVNRSFVNRPIFGLRIFSVEGAAVSDTGKQLLAMADGGDKVLSTTNTGDGRYVFSALMSGASAASSRSSFKIDDESTETTTFNPTQGLQTGDVNVLYEHYPNNYAYFFRFGFKLTKSSGVANKGLEVELYDSNDEMHIDSWVSEPGKNGTTHYSNDHVKDGYGYHTMLREGDNPYYDFIKSRDNETFTLLIHNNGLVGYRSFSNFNCIAYMADEKDPNALGYYFSTVTAGQGDDIFLTVVFDEVVQVIDPSMTVNVRYDNTSKPLVFHYFSGTLSDKIVFRTTLDTDAEIYTDELRVTAINNSGIYDLGWNRAAQNRAWNTPKDAYYENPIAKGKASVDTRTPSVTLSSSGTTNGIEKSHTVKVTTSKFDPATSVLKFAWSEAASIADVKEWNEADPSETTFTKADGTGEYYFHLKLLGGSGKEKTFTHGPLSFDNSAPTISSVSSSASFLYSKTHTFDLKIEKHSYEAAVTELIAFYRKTGEENYKSISLGLPQVSGDVYTLKIEHTRVELEADSYATYEFKFGAKDSLGNVHTEDDAYRYGDIVAFDSRKTFPVSTEQNSDVNIGENKIYYNNKDSGDHRTLTFIPESGGNVFGIRSIMRNGELICLSTDNGGEPPSVTAEMRENGIDGFLGGKDFYQINFRSNAEGFYQIDFYRDNGLPSDPVVILLTGENSTPENYLAMYSGGRLLSNKVWRLATQYYYAYDIDNRSYYTGQSGKAPIFSSREKAEEYARFMELQDMEILYLDSSSSSIISALNSGSLSSLYKKAQGETTVAATGQIWVRYKTASWTPGGSKNSQDWVYYHYLSGNTAGVKLDYATFSENLKAAIENNVDDIAGEDGWIYLTKNNGLVDEFGQPAYPKEAIFDKDLTFTGDVYEVPVTYSADRTIWRSTVEGTNGKENVEVAIVRTYTARFASVYGKMYVRAAGTNAEYSVVTNGTELSEVISSTGLYEIVELGNGYRQYFVYFDNSAPIVQYDIGQDVEVYMDSLLNGTTLRSATFSLIKMLSADNYDGDFSVELDKQAYIYITNQKGEVTLFITLEELDELSADGGLEIEKGLHTLHVYDRLGNGFSVSLRINPDDAKVTFDASTGNNMKITINRGSSEIVDGTFAITLNGNVISTEITSHYEFVESGVYNVRFTDIYGTTVDEYGVFERKSPTPSFYYYDELTSRFVEIIPTETIPTEETPAFVQKTSASSYYVVASTRIRLGWKSVYQLDVLDGEPVYTLPEFGDGYMFIETTGSDWIIRISYKKDPNSYITVSCIPDNSPPEITANAEVPKYSFGGRTGHGNVLFTKDGTEEVSITDGAKRPASSVTLSWTDFNPIGRATVSKDGGDAEDVTLLSVYTATEPGLYTVTVTDVIGNTAVMTFEITSEFDLGYTVGGEAWEVIDDPESLIENDEFLHTDYTGKEVRFTVSEETTFAFLYREGDGESFIYGFQYYSNCIVIYVLDQDYYESDGGDITEMGGITVLKKIDLTSPTQSGVLFENPFALNYELRDGVLSIVIPECGLDKEFWQFRISDINDVVQRVVQIERSSRRPAIVIENDKGNVIPATGSGFVGTNTDVTVRDSSIPEDIGSILAYRKDTAEGSFDGIDPIELYNGGEVMKITEEGYYKLVVTNIYGNEQILQFKLSRGIAIFVDVTYDDGESASFGIESAGKHSYATNGTAILKILDVHCTVTVQKDKKLIDADITERHGQLSLTLTEIGEYSVAVLDECGNSYSITVSLKDPVTLEFEEAFLTGFNEKALKKSEHYTNAPVDLVYEALEAAGVKAVFYELKGVRYTAYDVISDYKLPYSEDAFADAIGKEGDGVYTVIFMDVYGNKARTEVRISTKAMLTLGRQIGGAMGEEHIDLSEAMENGLWTNNRAVLHNTAELSRLIVDGKEEFFENGVFSIILSSKISEENHSVEYTDEYGNTYSFVIHLYRKAPNVTLESDEQIVDLRGTYYIKGDFAYIFTDLKVFATYEKDSAAMGEYTSGKVLTGDGVYTVIFTDIAGNTEQRTLILDTVVDYRLQRGEFGQTFDGIASSDPLSIKSPTETLSIISIIKDGKALEEKRASFSRHGSYVVTVADPIGNVETLSFSIYRHAVNSFDFNAGRDYAITAVWHITERGKISYISSVYSDEDGNHVFPFAADGEYTVDLLHGSTNTYHTLEITIDNVAPKVSLSDMANGASTRDDVTLSGLTKGDRVVIYKDGKQETEYVSGGGSSTPIDEPGEYVIKVYDEAGNCSELRFTREFKTNTAANVVVLLGLLVLSAGALLFLGFKKKKKIK